MNTSKSLAWPHLLHGSMFRAIRHDAVGDTVAVVEAEADQPALRPATDTYQSR